MAIVTYPIILSVTEPNNEVGIIKVRQSDEDTQTLEIQITENGIPKSFEGLQPFFCAKLGQSNGLGIIEQKLSAAETIDATEGKFRYTFRQEDWKSPGRQVGYFSFRRMKDAYTYIEQFSTRDFYYHVTKSVFSDGIKEVKKDGSTYIWTFEDMLRLFQNYILQGEINMLDFEEQWRLFVESNKEILESVDPGGEILKELIEARKPSEESAYPALKDRLDATDAKINELFGKVKGNNDAAFLSLNGGLDERLIKFYGNNVDKINLEAFKINLITDLHYQKSIYLGGNADHGVASQISRKYLQLHGLFSKHCDLAIINGDNVHGREDKYLTEKANRDVKRICDLFACPPIYQIGNHDDACCYKAVKSVDVFLSLEELKKLYDVESFNQKYVNDEYKTIVLSVSVYDNPEKYVNNINQYPRDQYSVITNETFNFVKQALENCPDDYRVIIFQHCPLNGINGMVNDKSVNINHDVYLEMLTAFNEGQSKTITGTNLEFPIISEVDFSNKPTNRLMAVVSGHKHKDLFTETNGIRHVTRISQVCSAPDSSVVREIGTDSEVAVDIIEITNDKLTFNRLGVGNSLEFAI